MQAIYEDRIVNSRFIVQVFNILVYCKDGVFAIERLSKDEKLQFDNAVRATVDEEYA